MKLAWFIIYLFVHIVTTEPHKLQRARRNSQCPPYPCLPEQTTMPPCPSDCCTPDVMIPCNNAGVPASPTVQCPCGKFKTSYYTRTFLFNT